MPSMEMRAPGASAPPASSDGSLLAALTTLPGLTQGGAAKFWASAALAAQIIANVRLRRDEDFANGLTIGGRKMRELRARIFSAKYLGKPLVNPVFNNLRHIIERLRVNEVAARITEHARLQIEVA